MNKKTFVINKIHQLVKTAYGCTEIGAIGYPTAVAYYYVKDEKIKRISIRCSSYIYKNASRVGVPNLGACGVYMIAAVGAYICDPSKKLELFATVTPEQKKLGKKLVDENRVNFELLYNVDPVYCCAEIETEKGNIVACKIEHEHDHIQSVIKNNKKIDFTKEKWFQHSTINNQNESSKYTAKDFKFDELCDIVKSLKVKDLQFLSQVFLVNEELSKYGLKNIVPGSYTAIFKKTYPKPDWKQQIILNTASAIDARMSGAVKPVMSSCGSGDHGLTLSIPQYCYHKKFGTSNLLFLQGLCLANLTTWIIKSYIGDLSAFCGSVVAASTGALVGIAWQRKLSYDKIASLIENCLRAYATILCDGAKMNCTYKVASALTTGFMILEMIENNYGIIDKNNKKIKVNPFNMIKMFETISAKHSDYLNRSIVEIIKEEMKNKKSK